MHSKDMKWGALAVAGVMGMASVAYSGERQEPAVGMEKTVPTGTSAGSSEKRWSIDARLGVQYDDNDTVDEIDNVSNVSDDALVFDFSGTYAAYSGPEGNVEFGYDFSQSVYDDQTDFNLQSHIASITLDRSIGDIDAGLLYLYSRTLLGGDDFLGIHSITPSAGYSVLPELYLNGGYNFQDKNFIRDRGRDARQHAGTLDGYYFLYGSRAFINAGYRVEDENARNDELDFLGHFVHLRLKTPIPIDALQEWNPVLRLGYAYFRKDYSSVTASIGDKREDERTTLTASLTSDLTEHVYAKADYEQIEAISNLLSSDFDEKIITFSVGIRY